MIRLQNLAGATFLLIITLGIARAEASIGTNQVVPDPSSSDVNFRSNAKHEYSNTSGIVELSILAQNSTEESVSETSISDDEMLDALDQRQKKIESLKELKLLNNLVKDKEKLERLQENNFNVNNLEELALIQDILNNRDLNNEETLILLQKKGFRIENLKQLKQLKSIVGKSSKYSSSSRFSKSFAFKMLAIGFPATILVFLVATPLFKGFIGVFKNNYEEKYGNPPVPEGSVNLHSRSFKEISTIGNKVERINQDKFGNEEFLLLLKLNINMAKEAEGYQGLANCVDLMQAGIVAQKSFLKLEQTELRYRSRKQQEFYQYVADNLSENIEEKEGGKEAFAKKVKKKQAEILPLVTTEEGRSAIDTYTKEINALSKHRLALKLLSLFKKYELQDFSILKNVSDVVEGLQGKDLINSDDLISPVLENYESFEKLGPILGLSEGESTASAYAKILQVIGLTNRHGKSFQEFEQLVKALKQWEKPYKAISLVRKEYTEDKYSIPAEFKEDIPAKTIYQKYAKFLPDL